MAFSTMIKSLLLCAASLTLLITPSSSQIFNHLRDGESLKTGQALVQGGYSLILQSDCNVVLYEYGRPIWASGTTCKGTGCTLTMQNNGNLVLNDQSNKLVWSTNTNGATGNYLLILQSDRNLVIYRLPTWATGTNIRGSEGVAIAALSNGTRQISGAEQNKVVEMGQFLKLEGEE